MTDSYNSKFIWKLLASSCATSWSFCPPGPNLAQNRPKYFGPSRTSLQPPDRFFQFKVHLNKASSLPLSVQFHGHFVYLYLPQQSCGGYTGISLSVRTSVCLSSVTIRFPPISTKPCTLVHITLMKCCILFGLSRSKVKVTFWGQFAWFQPFPDKISSIYYQISTKPCTLDWYI